MDICGLSCTASIDTFSSKTLNKISLWGLCQARSAQGWVGVQTQDNQNITFPGHSNGYATQSGLMVDKYDFVDISRKEILALFHWIGSLRKIRPDDDTALLQL